MKKIIIVGFFFIGFNLYLTTSVFYKANKAEDIRKLQSFHLKFQIFLGRNLFNNCRGFLQRDVLEKFKQEYFSLNYDYDLVETRNFSVGEFEFFDLLLRSYSRNNSSLEVISKGYLVKRSNFRDCFGIM